MSTLLDSLAIEAGNPLFHSEEYMRYISAHVPYLKENGAGRVEVNPGLAYKFEYNFFSLLVELQYDFEDFVVLLLVNGFRCPTEMRKDFRQLILPNPEVLAKVKSLFRHQNKRI
jgi:hypothetical protein